MDGAGKFWHDGELVAHPGMARAFASWIARHPDDGRFILSNGYDWSYFSVDDVPFFVQTLRIEDGAVTALLSDGSEEPLAADTLQVGAQDAVYVRVKGGNFEARFTPGAQAALAPLLVETPSGEAILEIAGKQYGIRSRVLQ